MNCAPGRNAITGGHAGRHGLHLLFKDDIFPIIRFNMHDVTEEVAGPNPLGIPFRRMRGFNQAGVLVCEFDRTMLIARPGFEVEKKANH